MVALDGAGAQAWRIDIAVPQGASAGGHAPAVVVAGVAYAATSGTVLAVRVSDGTVLWSAGGYPPPDRLYVVDNLVIAYGAGSFAAFDQSTGRPAWSGTLDGPATGALPRPSASTTNTPLLTADGLLVFGMTDGRLRALSPRDGRVSWTTRMPNAGPVTAAGSSLLVLGAGGKVRAYTTRGRLLWTWSSGTRYRALAWLSGRVAVLASDPAAGTPRVVVGVDAVTGRQRWRTAGVAREGRLPADDVDVLGVDARGVLVRREQPNRVALLGLADGRQRWVHTMPADDDPMALGSTATTVVTTDHDVRRKGSVDTVAGRDRGDGHIGWRVSAGPGVSLLGPYGSSGSTEYVLAAGDRVAAVDVARHRLLWAAALPLPPRAPVVAGAGRTVAVVWTNTPCPPPPA